MTVANGRGFHASEFQTRTRQAQDRMAKNGRDALLLTTEADERNFTGFLTRLRQNIIIRAGGSQMSSPVTTENLPVL